MEIDRKKIHFVGIGGAGMCGIAEVLFNMGHLVSGSDISEGQNIKRLKALGITAFIGHDGSHVEKTDIVVFSSAISRGNPELIRARELKIPIISRGEMLGELMVFKRGIAIAGTHGKTTTTSIIASILGESKLDPTIVIGGKFLNLGSNAKLGKGNFLVAEVDESDKSFLKALPNIATITNIEPDHINMYNEESTRYRNFDEMISAFSLFVKKIPLLGKIIINQDDPILAKICGEHIRDYIFFSLKDKNTNFYASDIKTNDFSSFFIMHHDGNPIGEFKINTIGKHNIMNALAATATAYSLGVPFDIIKRGLESFSGVERRLEVVSNKELKKIIVDYGHHPTEIRHTLETLKSAFPDHRLTVIFQPHRYTRTEYLFNEFTKSFSAADNLFITDIYKASEKEIPGVTGEKLARATPGAKYISSYAEVLPKIKELPSTQKHIVLFLGAGDIYKGAFELKTI